MKRPCVVCGKKVKRFFIVAHARKSPYVIVALSVRKLIGSHTRKPAKSFQLGRLAVKCARSVKTSKFVVPCVECFRTVTWYW
jgi:hypothetical protein